jgi:DNA-binding GntR family transcriptional regulator
MRIPRGQSLWASRLVGDAQGNSQEVILAELRRVILDGGAPPGTPIPVDDVAQSFGVSRIPVREALKTLASEGLVSQRPRSEYRVARLTRSELQQFYAVRGALELAALTTAIELADQADDERVIEAHTALQQAVEQGDVRGHHRESRRFHFALLEPSRMDRMLHMLTSAWNMTEPVQPMTFAGPLEGATFNFDHQQMLDAYLARDIAKLIAATTEHHHHLQDLIDSLPHQGGQLFDE